MDQYVYFAAVYDTFMEEVPRDKWAAFIKTKLDEAKITGGILLDLGCGTGVMTRRFSELGYDMIGVDGSIEMLNVAKELSTEDEGILYLCQDFSELELYGTVNAVISTCDCMNYILDKDELKDIFRLVNNYLEKDGLFIFDINTEHKYKDILSDNTFAEDEEDCAYIWQNYYDEVEKINSYGLTLFIEDEDGSFIRSYEEHQQRAYSLEEIKILLEEAGLEFVGAFDDYSDKAIDNNCERITIIAKEGYQEGKYYE